MRNIKKVLLVILPALLITVAGYSQNAQRGASYLPVELKNDTCASYISFTADVYNNISYLKWTVKNQAFDGIYCIERSFNGTDFETIGLKEGIGTDIKQPLLYCFTEAGAWEGITSYRIKHISETNTVAVSPVIKPIGRQITNAMSQQ